MEEFWTQEFKDLYDELDEFGKKLFLFLSVENSGCSQEYLDIILDKFSIPERAMIIHNFNGNQVDNFDNSQLEEFDFNETEFLKNRLQTLDGTLLCDIIARSFRNHKIFKK